MMIQHKIKEWVDHSESLNQETLLELKGILGSYPYFQTVRLLYLKNLYLLKDASFEDELRKSALFVADLSVLFYFIEGERFTIKAQEQEMKNMRDHEVDGKHVDRTLDLIDRFLSEMSDGKSDGDQSSDLSALNVPVVSDYTSVLEKNMDDSSLLTPQSDDDEAYMTERLARIYVKQQRYDKALEIIRKINLKYPEKNAYFADQIRFLEKLIINAKTK